MGYGAPVVDPVEPEPLPGDVGGADMIDFLREEGYAAGGSEDGDASGDDRAGGSDGGGGDSGDSMPSIFLKRHQSTPKLAATPPAAEATRAAAATAV